MWLPVNPFPFGMIALGVGKRVPNLNKAHK